MKHIIAKATALFIVLSLLIPGARVTFTRAAENGEKTVARVINVVYDDSGSMIADKQGKGEYTDAWCKAQYSMEVFASMLGEEDVMNIFLMSKFTHFSGTYPDNPKYVTLKASERAKKVVTIKGSESVSQRVKDIQNLQCAAGNTPFATVKAAVYDFHDPDKGYASDAEQWLVILTDGAFDDVGDDISEKIHDIKSSDYEIDGVSVDNSNLKIIFFGMQTNAVLPTIETNEAKLYLVCLCDLKFLDKKRREFEARLKELEEGLVAENNKDISRLEEQRDEHLTKLGDYVSSVTNGPVDGSEDNADETVQPPREWIGIPSGDGFEQVFCSEEEFAPETNENETAEPSEETSSDSGNNEVGENDSAEDAETECQADAETDSAVEAVTDFEAAGQDETE